MPVSPGAKKGHLHGLRKSRFCRRKNGEKTAASAAAKRKGSPPRMEEVPFPSGIRKREKEKSKK
jgi:hypothetical protein